jgi:mono/diheme cytochrome c family protein
MASLLRGPLRSRLRRGWPALALVPLLACQSGPDPETLEHGQQVYEQYCLSCHQASGRGVPGMAPSVVKSDWVSGDEDRLIRVVLAGLEGPIEVNGESFDGVMGAQAYLTDDQVAAVLTWLRQSFDNQAGPVAAESVAAVRAALDEK